MWFATGAPSRFIAWGVYSGPAKGEWNMENAAITPENYRKYVTETTGEQFTATAYNPADWAQPAKDMGAKYTVLTARHHEGFALWPSTHPNAWHAGQAPLQRDFISQYVTAVRTAGLRVGLYYSTTCGGTVAGSARRVPTRTPPSSGSPANSATPPTNGRWTPPTARPTPPPASRWG